MTTPLHVHADHHPTVEAEHQVVLTLDPAVAWSLCEHILGVPPHSTVKSLDDWQLRLDPETALDLARAIRWEAEAYDECNRDDCQCIPHHDEPEAAYRPDPQRAHSSTPDRDHQAGATALSPEAQDRLTGDAS